MTTCPFCGKTLIEKMEKLDSVEDVLSEINRQFGDKVFLDGQKLIAFFSDLAPHLSKQRRLLGYFVECGGPQIIVTVLNASEKEKAIGITKIVQKMKDEMFVEEASARMICESFLFAIIGRCSGKNDVKNPDIHQYGKSPIFSDSQMIESYMTAEEQYQQGEKYYGGFMSGCIEQMDCIKAFEWYHKAALSGHPMAQCRVGRLYREGHGVEKDEMKAFEWFMKAANTDQNCPRGKFYVGRCYEVGTGVAIDMKEAVRWYTMAAQQNDDLAQNNLGNCYEFGEGVEKDCKIAAYWYDLSAKQGNPDAMYNLGMLYKMGQGVHNDSLKAFSLFADGAKIGHSFSIFQLGNCYLEGIGAEKNIKQAYALFKQAAEMGVDAAQVNLAMGYKYNWWETHDAAQEFFWSKKAADQGNSYAMLLLGECYELGKGVVRNDDQAFVWYEKAMKAGNECGAMAIQILKLKMLMDPSTRNLVEALVKNPTNNSVAEYITQMYKSQAGLDLSGIAMDALLKDKQ